MLKLDRVKIFRLCEKIIYEHTDSKIRNKSFGTRRNRVLAFIDYQKKSNVFEIKIKSDRILCYKTQFEEHEAFSNNTSKVLDVKIRYDTENKLKSFFYELARLEPDLFFETDQDMLKRLFKQI